MYTISIFISKFINFVINLLNLGSGYTWPGHLVVELFPKTLLKIRKQLPDKIIVVSGTNGKTTTVKLLKHIFEKNDMKVLSNETGANLVNGVVSSILINSKLNGKLPFDIAVFELDELNLSEFVKVIEPNILILLNLSRDQLDRYWEKEVILEKWEDAVENSSEEMILVLDKQQENFEKLNKRHEGVTLYFDDNPENLKYTDLKGSFNAKNVNCALLAAEKFGVDHQKARKSLKDFKYAYGRGEIINYKNHSFQILLAKNPESLNQNLSLLINEDIRYDSVLFILNDNIPDGRDVSWIFDVDPDLIEKAAASKHIFVSGIRALDMAVRLKYAGLDEDKFVIESDIDKIVNRITSHEGTNKIIVLPNYSAMLNFREVVLGRKIL